MAKPARNNCHPPGSPTPYPQQRFIVKIPEVGAECVSSGCLDLSGRPPRNGRSCRNGRREAPAPSKVARRFFPFMPSGYARQTFQYISTVKTPAPLNRKGKTGRLVRSPKRDDPAATAEDSSTCVLRRRGPARRCAAASRGGLAAPGRRGWAAKWRHCRWSRSRSLRHRSLRRASLDLPA
jgi:hypothetical protein